MNSGLRDTYNRIARHWHADHRLDDWWVEGTEQFLRLLPPGGSILDVGCGAGTKAKFMADKGFQVTGIDFSDELLHIARSEAPHCHFMHVAMEELDRISEKFDGVFAQASLLHIPKKEAPSIVQSMAERLADGGYLSIAVKERKPERPEEEIVKERDYGYEYERFFSYYTLDELRQYLQSAGLGVISELRDPSPSGKTVWLQIIGRKC